jgi:hypothetical protein
MVDLLSARKRLEARIEEMIELLNILDGDPDLEDNGDEEPSIGNVGRYVGGQCLYDLETDTADDEPSLGWNIDGDMGPTFDPDRELDPSETEPTGDEAEGGLTWH